ncbi:MAG: ABC transporter substrate-binding protein [Acetatifactor sp.]|nr:ABC transporter substrate-binding protein [Acetatifactor sp.]
MARVNGDIYAVPNQQIIARQLGVVVQKEYADKYGLDMTSMSSIRDLEPFMDEIAANEPTLFPIDKRVSAIIEEKYENLVSITNGVAVFVDKETGEIASLIDVMDEQMRVDNEWYQKGYIRKDIATVTDNSADVKANRYVVTVSSYKPGWDAEFTQRQGVDYISIPIEGAYVNATSGIETMTAVNVNSEHPVEAVKLLNLVYSDKEIYNKLLYGLEGTHYNVVSENHVEIVEDSAYNLSTYGWKLGNQFNAWYMPGQEDGLWEATDRLNKEAAVSPLRGFTFDQSNVQAELAQLSAVNKEYYNGQFTAADIDKYIAEFKEKLEQAGMSAVMEEVQRQIDEWKAAQ